MLTGAWPVLSRQECYLCAHARLRVTHGWDEAYSAILTAGSLTLMFHLLKEQSWVKHRHNS